MRRIAVTGGSGFIGTNLVEYFAQQGVSVMNLDIRPPACEEHRQFWKQVDILDAATLAAEIQRFHPSEVVHLAARTDLDESVGLNGYRANIEGVQNVLNAIQDSVDLRTALFASSMLVCEVGYQPRNETDFRPNTTYGKSKVAGEQIVRNSTFSRWTIGRFTSIWGPWFGEPYRRFFELVRKGLYVNPDRSAASKTFGYVGNTVRQIDSLLLAGAAVHRRTFYIGDAPPINIADWADLVASEAGVTKPKRVPLALLRTAAYLGDMVSVLGIRLPMTTFRLRNMTTDNVVDLDDLLALAGKPSVSLAEGVRATLRWLDARASTPRV